MSTPGAVRVYLRDWAWFRQVVTAVGLASIVQPLMFLLGVGLGIGELVDSGGNTDLLDGEPYFAFYSSALLATTAMFVLGGEALWPTLDGFQWSKANYSMIATPLTPTDVMLGKALHFLVRGLVAVSGTGLVLLMFDDTRTWGVIPGVLAGVLCGMAFAMPLAALTATRDEDNLFPAIMRFGITPMFLFGGAFYPIAQLPTWLQPIAWITPLWHGIELARGSVLGGLEPLMALVHIGVLSAFVLGGLLWANRTFARRLLL
ncbi:MAG: ABC transporter permease [Actinomycetota bacterium]